MTKKNKNKPSSTYERIHSSESVDAFSHKLKEYGVTITDSLCRKYKVITHNQTGSSIMFDQALGNDTGYKHYMLDKLLTKVSGRKNTVFL